MQLKGIGLKQDKNGCYSLSVAFFVTTTSLRKGLEQTSRAINLSKPHCL